MKFLGIILDFTMVYLHYALLKVLQFLWIRLECACTASVVSACDLVHGCTKNQIRSDK